MTATDRPGLPTRVADWRLMGRTARLVITIPRYGLVAIVGAVAGLSVAVGSLNPSLVSFAVTADGLAMIDRLVLLVELYPFVGTGFGPLQGGLLLAVAALLGLDVALLAYHVREHGVSISGGGSGAAGLLLGALGAGCAACGTAVLAGLLSLVGVSVSLAFLPLDGLEFALLAAVVLVLSIHWVTEGMRGGVINGCRVEIE